MEAPKCQQIPSCGKRHYGKCGASIDTAPESPARPKGPKKKSKPLIVDARDPDLALSERVEVLETIVAELCRFRKNRSEYMKVYMRDKREKERGG